MIVYYFQQVVQQQYIQIFDQMQQENNNQNWMPLQSNPQVINTLTEKLGLKLESFSFTEMLSTEEWALQMIPKPSLGILMLYEQTPVQADFKEQEQASLVPEQVPGNVFFMKQYAKNACGTIALLHIIINSLDQHPNIVNQGSFLSNFRSNTLNKNANQRGQLLKNSTELLTEHKQAVSQGQSSVATQCNSHFIAFIPKNGHIYELDGFKKCAVNHGACSPEQFLAKGSEIIRKFMARDPDNLNFSMIVLAANSNE